MKATQAAKIVLGKLCAALRGYDKQYLSGKWFTAECNYEGWRWVMQSAFVRGRKNRCPWPVSERSCVVGSGKITFHPDDLNNFQHFGCYFQAKGNITIGRGTRIAPNVGIITANHDVNDPRRHMPPQDVVIGENCWIGMNSVILPGVTLGDGTVVGAGAVVTKSFPEGRCVIGGNPAKLIRKLEETP